MSIREDLLNREQERLQKNEEIRRNKEQLYLQNRIELIDTAIDQIFNAIVNELKSSKVYNVYYTPMLFSESLCRRHPSKLVVANLYITERKADSILLKHDSWGESYEYFLDYKENRDIADILAGLGRILEKEQIKLYEPISGQCFRLYEKYPDGPKIRKIYGSKPSSLSKMELLLFL